MNSLSDVQSEVLVYAPSFTGVNTEDIISYDFCQTHADALHSLYESLGDDKSRETFIAFMNQRISARPDYIKTVYDENHYFPTDIVALSKSEVFVDCGAYNGDSVNAFEAALATRGLPSPKKSLPSNLTTSIIRCCVPLQRIKRIVNATRQAYGVKRQRCISTQEKRWIQKLLKRSRLTVSH